MNVLGALYGRVTGLRRAWYARDPVRTRSLDRPVISVGNLAVGGSGKTPLVAMLARLLSAAGERPSILSRGYRRRESSDGVVVVSDAVRVLATAAQAGDEPYMLARALPGVPVLVSPDRFLAGRVAERTFGCSVHLLDDGFQHVQLARDVNLLIVSEQDLDAALLPFGTLREPLEAARFADAVLVPGTDDESDAVQARLGIDTLFRIAVRYDAPRFINPFGALSQEPSGRRALAFAGIARPHRFFAALRDMGFDVVREMAFRDHRWFNQSDVESIRRAAADAGADVVMTTEKDAVRLPDCPRSWTFLPLELVIEPADQFAAWLAGRLAAARRRAA